MLNVAEERSVSDAWGGLVADCCRRVECPLFAVISEDKGSTCVGSWVDNDDRAKLFVGARRILVRFEERIFAYTYELTYRVQDYESPSLSHTIYIDLVWFSTDGQFSLTSLQEAIANDLEKTAVLQGELHGEKLAIQLSSLAVSLVNDIFVVDTKRRNVARFGQVPDVCIGSLREVEASSQGERSYEWHSCGVNMKRLT